MRHILSTIVTIILILTHTSAFSAEVYEYNKTVTLKGKLLSKKRRHFLKLDSPIHLEKDPKDEISEEAANVEEMQLVIDYNKIKPKALVGKSVEVTGSMFYHHTAHHLTKVLVTVDSIK